MEIQGKPGIRIAFEEESYFEHVVLEEEVHRHIIQEILKLPDEQRKVVQLHLEGKNNLEIAEIMQISVNTVKPHKARARKWRRIGKSSAGAHCRLPVAMNYNVSGIPMIYPIAPDGKIKEKGLRREQMIEYIDALFS